MLADQIDQRRIVRRPPAGDRRPPASSHGEALILEIYCPDELAEYQEKIDELKFDDTIKD